MLAKRKIEVAKGCVFSLLEDAYVCRDTVSLIAFGGEEAKIVLPPTTSQELAYERLKSLQTGGKTPLLDALAKGQQLMEHSGQMPTLFVLVSDGKYSRKGMENPEAEIERFGENARRHGAKILLVDAEKSSIFSMGTARKLADRLGAVYMPIDDIREDAMRETLNTVFRI